MDITSEQDPFEMDAGFLEGAIPKAVVHTEPNLKIDFYPWHKPRKQWVRDNQWGALVGTLIDRLAIKDSGRALNYLSLPGVDLLDIRSLEEVFKSKGVKLKFLGLNYIEESDKAQDAEQNLSLNEVRSLDFIEQGSQLIREQFEKISDEGTIASQRVLKKHQTFDVVNIDLCASFADKKPGAALDSLYASIYKLLKHQSYYRTEDWLFFITSRTDKKKVEFSALKTLLNTVIESINEEISKEFIEDKIGLSISTINSPTFCQDHLSTLQHRNCFTSAFGIWKLNTLINGEVKSKSIMHTTYGYHVESTDNVTDMISMTFWCSRLPLVANDNTGLTTVKINPQALTAEQVYNAQARRAFNSSINCVDLDAYLMSKADEYNKSLERSKSLLKKARYSIDKYDDWVKIQENKILAMITPAS